MLDLVGNTPVISIRGHGEYKFGNVRLYAKLESYNPTGSIKDRPAAYIIRHMLMSGRLSRGSTVIESSSGNFGIALAAVCRAEHIQFICVVDPAVLPANEFLLHQYGAKVVKVTERDDTGGYLKTRIKWIRDYLEENPDVLWCNQYGNGMNAMAHYYGTGMEIYKTFSDFGLDYVFVPVGSGGTIAGVSKLLKEQFPKIKVIAVDTAGSVIFGGEPKRRFVPGMGSSIRPQLVDQANIDEVVIVDERECVDGCMELLHRHSLFVGGSSGGVYAAAKRYLGRVAQQTKEGDIMPLGSDGTANALMLFPDRGERYSATIYDQEWLAKVFPELAVGVAG